MASQLGPKLSCPKKAECRFYENRRSQRYGINTCQMSHQVFLKHLKTVKILTGSKFKAHDEVSKTNVLKVRVILCPKSKECLNSKIFSVFELT